MAAYRTNPTWAILLGSSLPGSESKVLRMLGSVVADFEKPLDDIKWRPLTGGEQDLSGVMRVVDGDFNSITAGLDNEELKLRLTQVVGGVSAAGRENEQQMSAKVVITWTLENHRQFFDQMVNTYHDDILRMIEENPRKDTHYAFMIVGIKTCIDAHISSRTQLSAHVDGSLNLPLDQALFAAGMPVPIGANIDLRLARNKLSDNFSEYSAKGERIFAVQYRRISIKRTLRLQKKTKYKDIHQVPVNRGLYGSDEENKGSDSADDLSQAQDLGKASGNGQNVDRDNKVLELGDGLKPGSWDDGKVYVAEF